MNKIKVFIADDYKIFRDGLKISLSMDENIELTGEAENGEELLSAISKSVPDVIILDLKMPVMNGMEATQHIRNKYGAAIKILVLSMYNDEKFVTYLKELGANGYLFKNAEPQEILHAIHTVYNTGSYFKNTL
jgi:DNA-binding NarL/FixJ family response regulator